MAKITKSELVTMIQEEIKRATTIKTLKEERSRITKMLREMEEPMMEDEAVAPAPAPVDAKALVALPNVMNLLGDDADKIVAAVAKKDPKLASKMKTAEGGLNEMVEQGIMETAISMVPIVLALGTLGLGLIGTAIGKIRDAKQKATAQKALEIAKKKAGM